MQILINVSTFTNMAFFIPKEDTGSMVWDLRSIFEWVNPRLYLQVSIEGNLMNNIQILA